MQEDANAKGGGEALVDLLAATREALATLRADELEALAARAEAMLERSRTAGAGGALPERVRAGAAAEHRRLGDLLMASDRNLQVLRRLYRRDAGGETLRWVR